jgi:beta-lactamase regulating signal transducer with metallopeptidase domain
MTAAALDLQPLAQLASEQLLNCAVEGIGIAVLAWALLRVLGKQNSGTRFAVWFSALLAIAGLPFLGHFAVSGTKVAQASEIMMPASWAPCLFAGWALIAAAGLLRVATGLWQLRRLRKNCTPLDVTSLDPLLQKTLQDFDSSRMVTVCAAEELRVPTALGLLKPLVVLPTWSLQELSPAELNSILLHELAHLRRWDDWTNFAQKIVGALLFFHPAVWWIEKKLVLEREMACDDLVLEETGSPRAYAECLVALAEKSALRRGVALAQAAVGRMRSMSLRVSQILDVDRPTATRVWRPAPALLAGASLVVLGVFANSPRLISFEDGAPGSTMAQPAATLARGIEAGEGGQAGARVIPARLEATPGLVTPGLVATASGRRPGGGASDRRSSNAAVSALTTAAGSSAPRMVPAKLRRREPAVPSRNVAMTLGDSYSAAQVFVVETRMIETQDTPAGITQTQVWQARASDASGSVVWNLCVWQVTVIGPAGKQKEPGIAAKSI